MTQVDVAANSATVTLAPHEKFFLKNGFLLGHVDLEWCVVPPFPMGCVIARLIYGWYFRIKCVSANETEKTIQVTGPLPRGSFHAFHIPAGCRYYINAHFIVGFSQSIEGMRTHIKIAPLYFSIRKHFFQVFHGPGTILLYGPSSFDSTELLDHQPGRIVAFDIQRRFTAIPPNPSTVASQIFNVVSHEVVWRFLEDGATLVENYSGQNSGGHEPHSFWSFIKHVLGFFRI